MRTILRILVLFILPAMMYSQCAINQFSSPSQFVENNSKLMLSKPEVTDLTIVPVGNLPAGGYLCSIIQNDKPIQSTRFILVK